MTELMIAPKAASLAENKRRGNLPNLEEHLWPQQLSQRHGEAITSCIRRRFDGTALIQGGGYREAALRELATMPSARVLASVAKDLTTAMDTPPNRRVTQAAVAVMFDSRVRAPANPEIYLDALVYDLCDEGFPPAVVVAACQVIRRERTFWPEIAEVIEVCRKKAGDYRALASLAARLCEDRVALEVQVRMADDRPAAPDPKPEPDGAA